MRKIIVSEFVTLDGVMEAPEKWFPQFWTAELQKFKDEEQFKSGALLLGRKTYEIFAASWPTRTGALADSINGASKFVVSNSLSKADWNNSIIIKGNIKAEILKLKQQQDRDILVVGSGQLLQTLLQPDLVDELRLMISPIILGSGKRLFADNATSKRLQLAETKTFNNNTLLIYKVEH